jgi:alpha-N-arabinofuranosidase
LVEAANGDWFAVFLGVRPNGYPPCYHLGRETFMCQVAWNAEDDFPTFGDGGRVAPEMETSLPVGSAPAPASRDDFNAAELALFWNYLRTPNPELYSLSARPGFLRLRGSADGLDDVVSPAWVGRRQSHFALRAATCVEFTPRTEREEAGLVVRMNETHHYEIFLTLRGGHPSVVLRRRIGSLQAEVACQELPSAETRPWVLSVSADRDKYAFSFGPTMEDLRPLGEGETRYLSTEVAGGFTGVYIALYASGNGAPCREPADFDWFDYQPAGAP